MVNLLSSGLWRWLLEEANVASVLAAEYLHEEVADLRKLKEKAETAPKSKKKDTAPAPKPPMASSFPLRHLLLLHLVFEMYTNRWLFSGHCKIVAFCVRQGAPLASLECKSSLRLVSR